MQLAQNHLRAKPLIRSYRTLDLGVDDTDHAPDEYHNKQWHLFKPLPHYTTLPLHWHGVGTALLHYPKRRKITWKILYFHDNGDVMALSRRLRRILTATKALLRSSHCVLSRSYIEFLLAIAYDLAALQVAFIMLSRPSSHCAFAVLPLRFDGVPTVFKKL